jgi:hypothetical protein
MQAIEVFMTPTAKNNHVSIADWIACINSDYQKIFDFFQHCVAQNLIINKCTIVADGVCDITRYYTVDRYCAEMFQKDFETQLLDFSCEKMSMKQFWNKFQFDIDINLKLVNFESETELLDLVDHNTGEIWNTKFPLIDPYDHNGNLQ